MPAGITFCRCSFEKLLFESEFLHTLCNFSSCCFDKLTLLTTNSKLGLMVYLRSFFKIEQKKLFTTSLVLQFIFTNRNLDYPHRFFSIQPFSQYHNQTQAVLQLEVFFYKNSVHENEEIKTNDFNVSLACPFHHIDGHHDCRRSHSVSYALLGTS